MKILVSWLNDYGDFADVNDPASIERLTDTLTSLGLEVGDVEHVGQTVDGVVITASTPSIASIKGGRISPDSAGTPQVVTLMDHPSNLRHPTWWHARDYGFMAANPFGRAAFHAGSPSKMKIRCTAGLPWPEAA